MNKFKTSLLATALLVVAPMAMAAGSASTSLNVTLTLENTCGITASPVNFGTQTSLAADIDATGSVTVTCTSTGGVYNVAFNGGAAAGGGTIAQRKLLNGASNTIDYNLYTTAGRTVLLGDGTTGVVVSGTGNGAAQAFTVYGRVAGGQNPKPVGVYTDVVTATVSF
ncbi:spore coat U domain-containing protein [Lysobacter koreensis]|uniref:Spore coat U domain-containing protein n=1 Tax=Lysobacter koreensis TaxID=266122 RepID=A0ABW2YMY3_9GAMM